MGCAVSILLVVGFHAQMALGPESAYPAYLGGLGVSIFFVISGLLITWLMIREREATGAFSLANFYIRRALRILPVYWVLLLVVAALKAGHVIAISWTDILRALTFTHNYPKTLHPPTFYSWWLSHTWSISVEEQFYLLWPSLFFFLPKRFAPRLALALTFSGPVLRVLDYFLFPSLRGWDSLISDSHIDILMAGCASAYLLDSRDWAARIRKFPTWPALSAASLYILVAHPFLGHLFASETRLNAIIGLFLPTIQTIAIALLLLILIAGKHGVAFRLANQPVARYIGKLSYSLYIWQQLFLPEGAAVGVVSLICRLAVIYFVAFCSFNFLERPFVGLRSRFRRGITV
jgi:peptidoglycan/LPS O-acetylase OafA/YrhL